MGQGRFCLFSICFILLRNAFDSFGLWSCLYFCYSVCIEYCSGGLLIFKSCVSSEIMWGQCYCLTFFRVSNCSFFCSMVMCLPLICKLG